MNYMTLIDIVMYTEDGEFQDEIDINNLKDMQGNGSTIRLSSAVQFEGVFSGHSAERKWQYRSSDVTWDY